jgi:hypothetical protein
LQQPNTTKNLLIAATHKIANFAVDAGQSAIFLVFRPKNAKFTAPISQKDKKRAV